jgi:RNA polymerase sigma-70 factor (ECF subfamily)
MRESEKNNIVKVDDERSIEQLCDDTWESLYRFIYFKVQNREETEDIIQESYLKAISFMQKNNVEIDKCMGFLKTTSLNVLRDKWRKNKRQGIVLDFDNINPEEAAIEDTTENIAQHEVIENALNLLNEEQHTVIDLRILKGYSVADTAKVMNKKEDNIRVLQYRALQNLRKIFNNGGMF